MKLFSWNVNGIRAVLKKGELQKFMETEQPDVLCLQETKAQPDQIDWIPEGYFVHYNSAVRKGYSSTALFSREAPLGVLDNFPKDIADKYQLADTYGDGNIEGRVIAAEFADFWVVTVYTPNSKGDLSRLPYRDTAWDPAFLEYVLQLEKTKPVLFCGDLNVAHQPIDLARPDDNNGKHGFTLEERAGFDKIISAGYVDTFRTAYPDKTEAYSWWTAWGGARQRNVGWRIDYWMASKTISERVQNPQIHPQQMGSDHCPVSIELV